MMKKLLLTILITAGYFSVTAQVKQTGFKLGIHLLPTLSKSAITGGSNDFIAPGSMVTFKDVADSCSKKDKMAYTNGIGLSFMYNLKRDIEFQTGLYYYQTGFVRTVENIKFLDYIYPGEDLVVDQAFDKTAYFNYRFRYLHMPLMINYGLPFKNMNFQYNLYATGGIGINYLLDSKIRADLEGFTMNGESKLDFDSVGFDMKKVTMHGSIGFRFEYLMKNKIILSVQPLFNYNLIPSSSSQLQMRPYSITAAVGVNYRFQTVKDEKK